VHTKKHILEIIALAERKRLVIISDEIYEFFTMPNVEYHSFAQLSENVPVLGMLWMNFSMVINSQKAHKHYENRELFVHKK